MVELALPKNSQVTEGKAWLQSLADDGYGDDDIVAMKEERAAKNQKTSGLKGSRQAWETTKREHDRKKSDLTRAEREQTSVQNSVSRKVALSAVASQSTTLPRKENISTSNSAISDEKTATITKAMRTGLA